MTIIFQDDFENGLELWDGVEVYPNTPIIQNVTTHHGTKAVSASLTSGLGAEKWADVYKVLGYYEALYYQIYIKITALPAAGNRIHVMWFGLEGLGNNVAGICIFHDGASPKWQVYGEYIDYLPVSTIEPQINTWYPVLLYYKRGTGNAEVAGWINDVSIGSATGKTYVHHPYYAQVGIYNTQGGTTATVYGDCAKVSTERIYADVVPEPIIYPTIHVQETTSLHSTSSAIICNQGTRVRTIRHTTALSPWTSS